MKNNIYVITRDPEKDDYAEYDANWGFVVIAFSELNARAFVFTNARCGDEPREIWLDEKITTCKLIGKSNLDEQIVLTDFNAA